MYPSRWLFRNNASSCVLATTRNRLPLHSSKTDCVCTMTPRPKLSIYWTFVRSKVKSVAPRSITALIWRCRLPALVIRTSPVTRQCRQPIQLFFMDNKSCGGHPCPLYVVIHRSRCCRTTPWSDRLSAVSTVPPNVFSTNGRSLAIYVSSENRYDCNETARPRASTLQDRRPRRSRKDQTAPDRTAQNFRETYAGRGPCPRP